MPHATNEGVMADVDEDAAIRNYLQGSGVYGADSSFDHAFDQGDKDENAVDYEDISDDDDLPEEEEASHEVNGDGDEDDSTFFNQVSTVLGGEHGAEPRVNGFHDEHDAKSLVNGDHHEESSDLHDLFGDEHSSSPEQHRTQSVDQPRPAPPRPGLALPSKSTLALPGMRSGSFRSQPARASQQSPVASSPPLSAQDGFSPVASAHEDEARDQARDQAEEEADAKDMAAVQWRMLNNARRRMDGEDVVEVAEIVDLDVFYTIFPGFDPSQNPDFIDLFPPRKMQYRRKMPLKPPKVVLPTKVTLEILQDQERSFKSHKVVDSGRREGMVYFGQGHAMADDSDDDLALSEFDENERIGGVTAQDLSLLCEDWDIPSADTLSRATNDDDWEFEEQSRPRKKARTSILDTGLSMSLQAPELSYEDPERATAKLARSVALDMNDPNLLIDEIEPAQKRRNNRTGGGTKRDQTTSKDFAARRYNISNDEAYDQLKENHQHKVRSTIGSNAIEHSLPAARLQYPFYKVNLDNKQKRAFHRPQLDIRDAARKELKFSKPKRIKRKHINGKKVQELFHRAEDLSVGDNSNLLLLEYSEEAPLTLSNFGMGNRLVNYYRKKGADDNERPKRDFGDTQVLLPQDKSPFANFGHVDSGEVVPTIQNAMYRAPVFAHSPKQTDFLIGVSSTYMSGHRLFIRNVENLHTVGQQFPVSEVPTEHSRKVTNAAKARLRTLAHRILRKYREAVPGQKRKPLTNENLMPHLPGHDMPQLRSKMREFMKYERGAGKDAAGVWNVGPGQQIHDEETLRGWVTPTDICLLDSMQVGVQNLADLGYNSRGKDLEKEDDDIDESANIEIQLAPWNATKSFLAATQSKAMLALHGEGDPTGRGEAFSFVKTSMKGGYQAFGESAQDKITAKKRRETGGHSYNVAQQQKAYDDSIRRIWEKQKQSLSNDVEMSDFEPDEEPDASQSAYPTGRAATPRSSFGTPAFSTRYDDESASQFSRGSASRGDKVLTIQRLTKDKFGNDIKEYEKVTNPRVIQLYRKRKMEQDLMQESLLEFKPTGDAEFDTLKRQQIQKELERIQRNADRRTAREKQKGRVAAANAAPGSPGPSDVDGSNADGTPQKGGRGRNKDGTARKCANCGQVGHIKTNRKLCPMLNGTMKAEDAAGGGDSSFGAAPAPLIL